MRIASGGRAVFAVTMVALGIMGLFQGEFDPVSEPVQDVPAREVLVYLGAFISLASGIGLLWRRTVALAARVLLGCLLLWLLLLRVPGIFLAPGVNSWWAACKTAVMVAGAWVLYVQFAADWDRRSLRFATGDRGGLRIARVLYGLALIPFGIAHFVYLKHTAELVPGWLPWHVAWAYLTGVAFIAAGVALVIGVYARLAAVLSAFEIGVFLLLVWVPIVAAGSKDPFQWNETIVSWALMAGAWAVEDSYRGTRWLAAGVIENASANVKRDRKCVLCKSSSD